MTLGPIESTALGGDDTTPPQTGRRAPSPRVVLASVACSAKLRLRGVRAGLVRCDGRTPVLYGRGGGLTIGPGLSVRGRTSRAEFGTAGAGRLSLGREVYINQGASIVASSAITIGDRVRIGDGAAIHDSDYHPIAADLPTRVAPIVVENDVWIGRGAVVMPGVRIGTGSVIAAGAVVTHSVPPRTVAAGVPARVIRELQIPAGWQRH